MACLLYCCYCESGRAGKPLRQAQHFTRKGGSSRTQQPKVALFPFCIWTREEVPLYNSTPFHHPEEGEKGRISRVIETRSSCLLLQIWMREESGRTHLALRLCKLCMCSGENLPPRCIAFLQFRGGLIWVSLTLNRPQDIQWFCDCQDNLYLLKNIM